LIFERGDPCDVGGGFGSFLKSVSKRLDTNKNERISIRSDALNVNIPITRAIHYENGYDFGDKTTVGITGDWHGLRLLKYEYSYSGGGHYMLSVFTFASTTDRVFKVMKAQGIAVTPVGSVTQKMDTNPVTKSYIENNNEGAILVCEMTW